MPMVVLEPGGGGTLALGPRVVRSLVSQGKACGLTQKAENQRLCREEGAVGILKED
jgi:hypothetical protein